MTAPVRNAHYTGPIIFLVLAGFVKGKLTTVSFYDWLILWKFLSTFGQQIFQQMATNRNSNASEFRQVLSRLKEVQEKLENSDQSRLTSKLSDMNDSLNIIEGNQTDFSDAVLQTLERIQTTMENGFKAIEDRISALEDKVANRPTIEAGSDEAVTPPSSSRKRKISRHPDLSHYIRSKMEQLGLLWNTEKKENEPPNKEISTQLLKEVQEVEQIKIDSLCTERRILDAISQNFASNKKRRRQMENGTYQQYQREQKRRQRIKRKLEKRLKVVTDDEKKTQLFESLHVTMMSSDESDGEEDTLVTRPLAWRAEEISSFFHDSDARYRGNMSNQQKRQSVNRRVGLPSDRNSNEVPEKLLWGINL